MDCMRKKELQMKISYETNRLAETYIANAYEQIIPIIKHPTNTTQEKTITQTLTALRIGRS